MAIRHKEGKRYQLPRSAEGAKERREQRPGARRERPDGRGRGANVVEGVLHVHRDGFGFVHPLVGEGENVYLPPEQAARALDNDVVRVEVVPSPGGRTSGRLLHVVERRRQMVVGTYRQVGAQTYVDPHDSELPGPIHVPPTQIARDGDVVKVRLGVGRGLVGRAGLVGEVAGSVGRPGDSSAEVLSIAFAQGFHDEFPPEVMDEADAIPLEVSEAEAREKGRRDIRHLPLVTIDGEDARDFDDAIYVEDHPQGFRLVVAIADVSHYVREGSALDAEALRRGTSVYLPDRVLPMLPERLSNGICSLRPEEDRLCMVADMVFDRHARMVSSELYPGVMRSAARCTYGEVHRVLAGEDVPHRNAFRPHFVHAMALAEALRQMRKRRGAIDFDLPETRIELDEAGRPARMVRRERWESHRLVEECMLAANEAVARFFQERKLPSVYRFHGEPDPEKLAAFADLARVHGFSLPDPDRISSRDLNAFLEQLEGHVQERALNQLLLRSMMQAVYSAERVGHFGLGAEHYLHFTSPIRRYPDLLVHRLLKRYWLHKQPRSAREIEAETERLERLAVLSSERERAAMQVEREVVSYYAALMMKERVGEELDAVVSSLADFGFFAELEGHFVEGLVRGETIEGRFRFDKARHLMTFPSGRTVRIGDRLRVRVASVNLQRRQIDLEVVAFEGEAPHRAPSGPPPGFQRLFERAERERAQRRERPAKQRKRSGDERPQRGGERRSGKRAGGPGRGGGKRSERGGGGGRRRPDRGGRGGRRR